MQHTTTPRVVLVAGADAGVGAEVARLFGKAGAHVVVNCVAPECAFAAAESIRAAGGSALPMAADLSDEAEAEAIITTIAARLGGLDAVVLTAAGAPRLSADAQRRLALLAIPLMSEGAHFVFATNHQAHFYPDKAVPMGYASTAATLRAGETALYAMRSEFERAGVHFSVVTHDLSDEGAAVAEAVVTAATGANPSGVVCVGRADYLMTA